MRHSGIIEMEGGVVPMFHLFCPRLYAGFQRDKTKRASNKNLLGTNMSTHLSAIQGSGVCRSHARQSSRVMLIIYV